MTNIVRHAGATTCVVTVGGASVLRIVDDGVGLGESPEGNGLTGLRERLADAGLVLAFELGPTGSGTAIVVESESAVTP